jgi:hypothetical protein
MKARKRYARGTALSEELDEARRRFERWREVRTGRARIPEALWAIAVGVAREHGLNQTAGALRLNYYGLKKRVDSGVSEAKAAEAGSRFVELIAPRPAIGICECVLELENAHGAKMRIQLKGGDAAEWARLTSVLWSTAG